LPEASSWMVSAVPPFGESVTSTPKSLNKPSSLATKNGAQSAKGE
jgi:hypothetical protein